MKKIVLMAVVLLSSVATFAQHATGSVSIKPEVGMTIADLTDWDGTDSRIGLAAGAEFEFQATDMEAFLLVHFTQCKVQNTTV